jgi:predicted transcriptional regulator
MKTAGEVIWQKSKINNIISPDSLVIEALNRLHEVDLSYLIVKEGNNVIGIFSERDYARKVALQGRSSSTTKVSEVMSVDLPEVQSTDSIETCMKLLASQGRRYILVYDKKHFEGVVTIHDLLREILLHGERALDSRIASQLIDINERPSSIY